MDNMDKTNIPNSITNRHESNYGTWWILLLLFVLLIVYLVNKYYFSTHITKKEDTTPNIPSGNPPEIYKNTSNITENHIILKDDNHLNNALDNTNNSNTSPIADNSTSSIQTKTGSGWCFIGEEANNRSCIEVGKNDLCMSGNIFPSHDICVNPTLRT